MEDRTTPGLFLELGNMEPTEYQRSRAPRILSLPGVSRVSWWKTLVPGRTDLPRTVAEGTMLGVAEVERGFSKPEPIDGFTSHHFEHCPRPGQGILTGRSTTGLLVVWISPRSPERSQELRDWGDFVHIRHIAAASVPGFTRISVYENVSGEAPVYLHFYELDNDDTEGAFSQMARVVSERLGGTDSAEFRDWADYRHVGGRLNYCNTFGFVGDLLKPADPDDARVSRAAGNAATSTG